MTTLETLSETANIAETLAREIKAPVLHLLGPDRDLIGLPPGWTAQFDDREKLMPKPRRKVAKVSLTEAESFIDYGIRHGSLANATVWCKANYKTGEMGFTAIINDHGEEETQQAWRDHRATFVPEKSEEWKRWTDKHGSQFSQVQFALFLEENLKDIISADGMPTGTQMLEMALGFEAKQDMRFKSAVRLQSGGVRLEYVEDEDKNTIASMQMFEKFQIAVPVFRADESRYPVTARLRYRVKEGALVFWFELIRADLVMEQASRALVETIRTKVGFPFFFGSPDA